MGRIIFFTLIKAILLVVLLSNINCYGQDDSSKDRIAHKGGKVFLRIYSKNGKELLKVVPMGTDVWIFHNTFFRNYSMLYKDEEGELNRIPYKFAYDFKDGRIKVTDPQLVDYILIDTINENGQLILIRDKIIEGAIASFVVEGLTRKE